MKTEVSKRPEGNAESCLEGRGSSRMRAGDSGQGKDTQWTPLLSFPPAAQQSPCHVWGTWESSVAAGDRRMENLEGLGPNMNRPRMPPHIVSTSASFSIKRNQVPKKTFKWQIST